MKTGSLAQQAPLKRKEEETEIKNELEAELKQRSTDVGQTLKYLHRPLLWCQSEAAGLSLDQHGAEENVWRTAFMRKEDAFIKMQTKTEKVHPKQGDWTCRVSKRCFISWRSWGLNKCPPEMIMTLIL